MDLTWVSDFITLLLFFVIIHIIRSSNKYNLQLNEDLKKNIELVQSHLHTSNKEHLTNLQKGLTESLNGIKLRLDYSNSSIWELESKFNANLNGLNQQLTTQEQSISDLGILAKDNYNYVKSVSEKIKHDLDSFLEFNKIDLKRLEEKIIESTNMIIENSKDNAKSNQLNFEQMYSTFHSEFSSVSNTLTKHQIEHLGSIHEVSIKFKNILNEHLKYQSHKIDNISRNQTSFSEIMDSYISTQNLINESASEFNEIVKVNYEYVNKTLKDIFDGTHNINSTLNDQKSRIINNHASLTESQNQIENLLSQLSEADSYIKYDLSSRVDNIIESQKNLNSQYQETDIYIRSELKSLFDFSLESQQISLNKLENLANNQRQNQKRNQKFIKNLDTIYANLIQTISNQITEIKTNTAKSNEIKILQNLFLNEIEIVKENTTNFATKVEDHYRSFDNKLNTDFLETIKSLANDTKSSLRLIEATNCSELSSIDILKNMHTLIINSLKNNAQNLTEITNLSYSLENVINDYIKRANDSQSSLNNQFHQLFEFMEAHSKSDIFLQEDISAKLDGVIDTNETLNILLRESVTHIEDTFKSEYANTIAISKENSFKFSELSGQLSQKLTTIGEHISQIQKLNSNSSSKSTLSNDIKSFLENLITNSQTKVINKFNSLELSLSNNLIEKMAGTDLFLKIDEKANLLNETIKQTGRNLYSNIDGLLALYNSLNWNKPLPELTGWAVSSDFAKLVCTEVQFSKPKLVMSLGSGSIDILVGRALQINQIGKLVSLEHLESYYEKTKCMIQNYDLEGIITLIHAPIKNYDINNINYQWYDFDAKKLTEKIDLLIVDGPPGNLNNKSRYPAVPLLLNHLKKGSIVLVDDAHRKEDKIIAKMWEEKYGFKSEFFNNARGTIKLIKL